MAIKRRGASAVRTRAKPSRRPKLALRTEPGRLAQAVEIHREEARQQTERWLDLTTELEESLERYLAMYHEAPFSCVTLGPSGVILELNDGASTLIGEPRDRAIGKPFLCYVDRADTKSLLSHLTRCARGAATTELRLRARPGASRRLVQLLSKRTWLPGASGAAFLTVITDLSERRQSEEDLHTSEKRHREIVETANEGICIVDARNKILFVNRRLTVLAGCQAEDLVGRSAFDLVPDADLEAAKAAFEQRETGQAGQSEQCLRRLDGSLVWTNVSTSLMFDDDGQFAGMLRMYTDTTTRRQLAESRDLLVRQLVEAQEQERQRIARELHDQMGQHIVALSLGLARLASFTTETPEAASVVARLQGVADLLGRDVHTLALELRPAALDHLGLSVALTSYVEAMAVRTGLEIDVHCDDITDINLSPDVQTVIYRIAQEAVTNVVKHATAHRVSVILERHADALQLIVEDDGVGFNPNAPISARLGLAGMLERASLIGAALTIESTPGRGATVYLRLPLVPREVGDHEETTLVAR